MPRKSRKKQDKIAQIVGDAYYEKAIDKTNVLASALWTISKGTQWEIDAKDIIMGCCPDFFI